MMKWVLQACVGCGECVQACPTGALMEKSLLDDEGKKLYPDKTVNIHLSLLWSRLPNKGICKK